MSPRRQDAKRHAKARKRRYLKAQERLRRDRRQAQQATEACQIQSEEASYGHLVLRLLGCFVLFDTSQVICHGRMTCEAIIFSLKHYWRFVDCEALELKALSFYRRLSLHYPLGIQLSDSALGQAHVLKYLSRVLAQ